MLNIDHEFISSLVNNNGPYPHQYEKLTSCIDDAYAARLDGQITDDQLVEVREMFNGSLSVETMQGFVLAKPHGYAGDFEIIDKIYRNHKTKKINLVRWDEYFHTTAGAKAVRNRKDYFGAVLNDVVVNYPNADVLNIASGPGRCMTSWMENNPDNNVSIHCIELDSKAIEYAKYVNNKFKEKISFEQCNLLRYNPTQKYNLIWASGIFDYFSDRVFRSLVQRLTPAIADGGSLVIGNFAVGNPSRAYMELLGEWMLNHRTPEQLIDLCSEVVNDVSGIEVNSEEEQVNLFLHIRK